MNHYVRWTEYNDHEGESWTFWLQRDGNEAALAELGRFLVELSDIDSESYALDLDVVLDAHDVGVLVAHGGEGYRAYHTRVDGRLTMPTMLHADDLYKGGVEKLFVTSEEAA